MAIAQLDTLDVFTLYLHPFLKSDASFFPPLGPNTTWDMDQFTFDTQAGKYYDIEDADIISFANPTIDIIHTFNEAMFRGAIKASHWSTISTLIDKGLSIEQTILTNQTITQDVFRSDLRWYAAATIVEIVIVLTVLPMFWGWWKLDKDLSLSPFAIGHALNAPLLRDEDREQGIKAVINRKGQVSVKYMAVAAQGDDSADGGDSRAARANQRIRMELVEIEQPDADEQSRVKSEVSSSG